MHKLRHSGFERGRRDFNQKSRRSRSRSPVRELIRRSRRSKSPVRRLRDSSRSREQEWINREYGYSGIDPSRPSMRNFNRSLSTERPRRSRERMYSPSRVGHGSFRRSLSRDRNERSREEVYNKIDSPPPLMAVSTAYFEETRIEPVQGYGQSPQQDRSAQDCSYNTFICPRQDMGNEFEWNYNNPKRNNYDEHHETRRTNCFLETQTIIPPPAPSFHLETNETVTKRLSLPENISQGNYLPIDEYRGNMLQESEKEGGFQGALKRDKLEIPIFRGNDSDLTASQFLESIDSIGSIKKWSGGDKKLQMAARLEGPARDWFLSQDSINFPWPKIKNLFLKEFNDDMQYYNKLKKMMARCKCKEETYSKYFSEKVDLLEKCQITNENAVSCLIGGLDDGLLKKTCFNMNFKRADELFEFLTREKEQDDQSENNLKMKQFRKQVIHVFINGCKFEAFNCNLSQECTIRQKDVQILKVHYNPKNFLVTGYRGASMSVLGSFKALFKINSVSVNSKVFVVPDSFQDYPVIIGESLRANNKVIFSEDADGIYFSKNLNNSLNKEVPQKNTSFNNRPNHHLNFIRRKSGNGPVTTN